MMSEPAEERAELVLRDHIVVQADGSANLNYQALIFLSDLGPGAAHTIPIILVAEVESKLLVAIPFNSWNRLVRLRLLPPNSLSKVVSVAVAATEADHRELVVDNIYIKVWIGFLNPAFEECIGLPESGDLEVSAFPTEDEEEGFLPFGEALVAVADEKFSFLTAESGGGDGMDQTQNKIAALEAGLSDIRAALNQLMGMSEGQYGKSFSGGSHYKQGCAITYKRRWYSRAGQSNCASCSSSWNRQRSVGTTCNDDRSSRSWEDEGCSGFGSRNPQDEAQRVGRVRRRARSCGSLPCFDGGGEEGPDDSCHFETDYNRWFLGFVKAEVEAGRHIGRCCVATGWGFLSFSLFRKKAFSSHSKPQAGTSGPSRGNLCSDGKEDARRLWCCRRITGGSHMCWHISWLGRTQVSDTEHPGHSSDSLGDHWRFRRSESRSHRRGESASDFTSCTDRSTGRGSRPTNSIFRRIIRRCSTVLFVLEARAAGHLRESAYKVVASYLGRSLYLEDQRTIDDFVERRQKLGRRTPCVKPDPPPTVQPKAEPKKKTEERGTRTKMSGEGTKQPLLRTNDA